MSHSLMKAIIEATLEEIAANDDDLSDKEKHNNRDDTNFNNVMQGVSKEMEYVDNFDDAFKAASDHLKDDPNYYEKQKKINPMYGSGGRRTNKKVKVQNYPILALITSSQTHIIALYWVCWVIYLVVCFYFLCGSCAVI